MGLPRNFRYVTPSKNIKAISVCNTRFENNMMIPKQLPLVAGSSRNDLFPSRYDDGGGPFHPRNSEAEWILGFASDEDADLADELLVGFEEGVSGNEELIFLSIHQI